MGIPPPTQEFADDFYRWLKSRYDYADVPYADDFGDSILVDGDFLKVTLGCYLRGIWLLGHLAGQECTARSDPRGRQCLIT